MSSFNKVILIGYVGQEPKVQVLKTNGLLASFSVATSESWKDKQTGEQKQNTQWHRISVMNDHVAKFIQNYVKKGDRVCVEGKLQTREWTDKNGIENKITEVAVDKFRGNVMLLSNKVDGDNTTATAQVNKVIEEQLNDEIPF